MNKKVKLSLNVITLIIFHILYWLIYSQSRRLISTNLYEILFNLAFLIIYFWALYVIIGKDSTIFSSDYYLLKEPFLKKTGLIKIVLLLAVQLFMDFAEIATSSLNGAVAQSIGLSLALLLFWFLTYVILTHNKNDVRKCNAKQSAILIALVLILSALFVVLYMECIRVYDSAINEYLDSLDFTSLYDYMGAMTLPPKAAMADGIISLGRICYDISMGSILIIYRTMSKQST